MALELGEVGPRGGQHTPGRARGVGRGLVCAGPPGAHLRWILAPVFFINSAKIPPKVSGHSENFYFCTKTTPWQFC